MPPEPLSTEVARGLLPSTVPHADAAADAGKAALLVAALAGRPDQLWRATRDYLHQDYRRPAMPASLGLVDRLRADGHAAVVSGAGPTVLALVADGHRPRGVLPRRAGRTAGSPSTPAAPWSADAAVWYIRGAPVLGAAPHLRCHNLFHLSLTPAAPWHGQAARRSEGTT